MGDSGAPPRPLHPYPIDAGRAVPPATGAWWSRRKTKPWPFVEIAESVSGVLGLFVSHVSKDLLGDRWERQKAPQG
jgi:hypothetical protein